MFNENKESYILIQAVIENSYDAHCKDKQKILDEQTKKMPISDTATTFTTTLLETTNEHLQSSYAK